jgi:two-component system phosphate regulon response regulator PhoB
MARILSVEDDEHIQHLIGQVLFQQGYEMHYAWNGQEGYEKVLSIKPDLILLDLMLPIMNGVEFLEKLKQQKPVRAIPVIIVTAYGDEADMLKYAVEALGAESYIRKPINFQELVRSVKVVLAQTAAKPRVNGKDQELRKGAVRGDPQLLTIWIDDRLVATLPYKEFALFETLIKSPGPMKKEELLRELGYEAGQGDALKQVLHRLRDSLGAVESKRIRTTPEGYELLG